MRRYINDAFARFKIKFYVIVVIFVRTGVCILYALVYVGICHCIS